MIFTRPREQARQAVMETMREVVLKGRDRARMIQLYRAQIPKDLLARLDEAASTASKAPDGPEAASYILGRVAGLLSAWNEDRAFYEQYKAAEKNINEMHGFDKTDS